MPKEHPELNSLINKFRAIGAEIEAEVERVMLLLDGVAEEKLRQATARISELEGENFHLREENCRVVKDNRELYDRCERAYRDVQVTQEQRASFADYRRR